MSGIIKKILFTLLIVITLCILSIVIVLKIPVESGLKNNLISEIVGSGIFGMIIAIIAILLEQTISQTIKISQVDSFLKNKLIINIKEVFKRKQSSLNLSGGKKFYFDGSYCNALFDVYEENFEGINNLLDFRPSNKLVQTYKKFYLKIRDGYTLGEKLDNAISQIVRTAHYQNNVHRVNDPDAVWFIKRKLFSLPDKEIIKYLDFAEKPNRFDQIESAVKKDKIITDHLKKINENRKECVELSNRIRKMVYKL